MAVPVEVLVCVSSFPVKDVTKVSKKCINILLLGICAVNCMYGSKMLMCYRNCWLCSVSGW